MMNTRTATHRLNLDVIAYVDKLVYCRHGGEIYNNVFVNSPMLASDISSEFNEWTISLIEKAKSNGYELIGHTMDEDEVSICFEFHKNSVYHTDKLFITVDLHVTECPIPRWCEDTSDEAIERTVASLIKDYSIRNEFLWYLSDEYRGNESAIVLVKYHDVYYNVCRRLNELLNDALSNY